jgi:hypothetical protein
LLSAGFVLNVIQWMHDNVLWFLLRLLPCLEYLLVYIYLRHVVIRTVNM